MYEKSYITYQTNNLNDMNIVYNLQQLAYQVEAERINYSNLPPLKESIHDLMEDECIYRGCSVKEDCVYDVGVIAYEEKKDMILIHKVVVHPDYFHKGIATFLLNKLVQHHPHCNTFTVVSAKKNHPARSLYEKFGFVVNQEIEKPGITLVEYVKKVD